MRLWRCCCYDHVEPDPNTHSPTRPRGSPVTSRRVSFHLGAYLAKKGDGILISIEPTVVRTLPGSQIELVPVPRTCEIAIQTDPTFDDPPSSRASLSRMSSVSLQTWCDNPELLAKTGSTSNLADLVEEDPNQSGSPPSDDGFAFQLEKSVAQDTIDSSDEAQIDEILHEETEEDLENLEIVPVLRQRFEKQGAYCFGLDLYEKYSHSYSRYFSSILPKIYMSTVISPTERTLQQSILLEAMLFRARLRLSNQFILRSSSFDIRKTREFVLQLKYSSSALKLQQELHAWIHKAARKRLDIKRFFTRFGQILRSWAQFLATFETSPEITTLSSQFKVASEEVLDIEWQELDGDWVDASEYHDRVSPLMSIFFEQEKYRLVDEAIEG